MTVRTIISGERGETAPLEPELATPVEVVEPVGVACPLVLSSPHSGAIYPRRFLASSRLDSATLRRSEDAYVDELFEGAIALGAPMARARFPRAYLDVNREPFELDPRMFEGKLPAHVNTRSLRVAAGLGTIARLVAEGEEIYRQPLTLASALERINCLYLPFHAALARLLEETRKRFGYAVLIDCHSMPSSPALPSSGARPDVVLGDRFGASCDPRIARFLRTTMTDLGYEVDLNRPYAGGYITEHYGKPYRGIHAVQVEINRGLYMDEISYRPSSGYGLLARDLDTLCRRLTQDLPQILERRAAAE